MHGFLCLCLVEIYSYAKFLCLVLFVVFACMGSLKCEMLKKVVTVFVVCILFLISCFVIGSES